MPGALLGTGDSAENETKQSPRCVCYQDGLAAGGRGLAAILSESGPPGSGQGSAFTAEVGAPLPAAGLGQNKALGQEPLMPGCPWHVCTGEQGDFRLGDVSELRWGNFLGVQAPRSHSRDGVLQVSSGAHSLVFNKPPPHPIPSSSV